MRTKITEAGKLTQQQITRLGGLIAFVCGRNPYPKILNDLISNGFVLVFEGEYDLTTEGQEELEKLTAMAGLRLHHYTDK